MPTNSRIIGRFGGKTPGALILAFGAIHGNEPAGVRALEEVFRMLEYETETNPAFPFQGTLTGVIGNRWAYAAQKRFIEKDLNRQWTPENIDRVKDADAANLHAEDREMCELLAIIRQEVESSRPEALILLDLHTTSAGGGIFSLPANNQASLRLAKSLAAPVVLGLADGIQGTLLHFAVEHQFANNGPKHIMGIAFEAGQHNDPLSVNRTVAVVINCLRAAGCIDPEALRSPNETALSDYAATLPKVTKLRYAHSIRPVDQFRMRPGYINFQPVHRSEHLADDVRGPIFSPDNGLILMPLYQSQGSDGFFIVQEMFV
ncbi:MAG TPA: succinylglutamate desuccinylase/aspartoacylase family protein [Saprospiraceae bacterium]|nr:succinylglutamate desuccinylase/aspartoacylase family protein [Saprospiraceae bacterium]HNM27698.1 succinylglutamate desuccinylase/aspartoacylase family protein [Saprospiraceae bacterium]